MIKLYRHALSGHSHRVELFLSILNLEYELIDVDLMKGEHKSESFLKLNPFGQVPVIDDDGRILFDSNAILIYLAEKYGKDGWYTDDPYNAAKIQQWLSIAAGPIASGPATARLITVFGADYDANEIIEKSHNLLSVINDELSENTYLTGSKPTIADIAAYTYIAHAPEGNVSLADYPAIINWLERIRTIKGFVGMQETKIGLAA